MVRLTKRRRKAYRQANRSSNTRARIVIYNNYVNIVIHRSDGADKADGGVLEGGKSGQGGRQK